MAYNLFFLFLFLPQLVLKFFSPIKEILTLRTFFFLVMDTFPSISGFLSEKNIIKGNHT